MIHLIQTLNINNLFLDFVNYIILVLIFIYSYKMKFIKQDMMVLLIFCGAGPFFVNHILIDWWYMPDQIKYFRQAHELRLFKVTSEEANMGKFPILVPSLFFSIFPIPFIESISSIGFINKGILSILTIVFFYKKIISRNFFYILNLWPTVFLYSSLSLKDTLSFVLSLIFAYSLISNRNYFINLILLSIIFLVKPINGILFIFIFIFYRLFFVKDIPIIKILNYTIIILILAVCFYNYEWLINKVNRHRFGFFYEANSGFTQKFEKLTFNFYFFYQLFNDLIRFTLSPFPNINSPIKLFQFVENLTLYYFLYQYFVMVSNINLKKVLFWFSCLFICFLSYSVLIFSDGSIARYKYVLLGFFIFIFYQESKKNVTSK